VRQLCNVAYAVQTEGLDDDEREKFEMEIGMAEDPADVAMAELKAHQEAAGMTFENPDAPVEADPTRDADLNIEY
jgi:hypothetical protein